MKTIRKVATTLAGIFLAVLLIIVLAPRAARGVAAALVQVTNTSSNPVPVVAAAALNSFDSNGFCQFVPTDNGHNDFCLVDPIYTVPAGKIAVIEHASGRCIVDPGTGLREARLKIGPSGGLDNLPTQFSFFVPGPPENFPTENSIVSFAQSTKTYVAAGGAINLEIFATAGQQTTFDSCAVDISGYLVSQ
ncbi:MAG TPA: hypothetical protein VLY23_02505 [Candidatus Acidoferrum sp.]|nr:hypothetical protein [Candidatus Acidoferrum sp.]